MGEHGSSTPLASAPSVDVAVLMGLPGATARRLGRLLAHDDAAAAVDRVRRGRVAVDVADAGVRRAWRDAALAADRAELADRLGRAGLVATCWHHPDHPPELAREPDPAPTVIRAGRAVGDGPRVGIVGTRRCSVVGREIALELGAGIAATGVSVVSGLAAGIDGAAHRGALASGGAPPVAVVGSGPDVVYPARHRELWDEVASAGTLLSEAPLGAPPEAWRFPARNRLIASLSDVLVVVESRAAGGSLLTVEQALRRDVPVLAVPGSIRNPAAAGTNKLLADGAAPVCDVDDVLVALGLVEAAAVGRREDPAPARRVDGAWSVDDVRVLDAVDDGPTSLDTVVGRSALPVASVLASLQRLAVDGAVSLDGGRYVRSMLAPGVVEQTPRVGE